MSALPTSPPASASTPRLLVLWDVDHTLIETRGVGRMIYERAFLATTGKRLTHLADISGRTERDIMSDSLRLNGIDPSDEMVSKLAEALVKGYEDARGELATRGRPLPGARETLKALKAEPAVFQVVLTGNLREVARIKLEIFDLARYLDLDSGAYGDDDADRAKLVQIAQARARQHTGIAFDNNHTILIGDTTKDVEAGLKAGVRVIGVATGRTGAEELMKTGPTAVVKDLEECRRMVEAMAKSMNTT